MLIYPRPSPCLANMGLFVQPKSQQMKHYFKFELRLVSDTRSRVSSCLRSDSDSGTGLNVVSSMSSELVNVIGSNDVSGSILDSISGSMFELNLSFRVDSDTESGSSYRCTSYIWLRV